MLQELRQVLAELEMCSHVSAKNLEPSARDAGEDIGGNRPSGGIDRRDDKEKECILKSADHFRKRLAQARTQFRVEVIHTEAEAALRAWRRAPDWRAGEAEPERGSIRWKRMIADSPDTAKELARRYEVSARTVRRYREEYGECVAV